MFGLNVFAVLAAAGSSFLLGGLWYSKALFGTAWGCAAGLTKPGQDVSQEAHGHPARVFALSFGFAVVAAACFALLIGPQPTLLHAMHQALVVGAGCVAASFGINYQFANRRLVLWLIDGGYHVAQFALFALVLGLWH